MEFPKDAFMKPSRDFPISWGLTFFMLRILSLINILTKLFTSEKGGVMPCP
jgi:hypothetical protein